MTTRRLLALTALALAGLALGAGPPWLVAALCLGALAGAGELWLRALVGDPITPAARLGLVTAAGLVTLPVVAIALHVLEVSIRPRSLTAGVAAIVIVLGAYVSVRDRTAVAAPARLPWRPAPTLLAVAVPGALAAVIGGGAVFAYQRLPHPAPSGYTSVALNGWAADIDRPVSFPARGLTVPIRVSSAGEPASTASLLVRVGNRPAGVARRMAIAADTTRSVQVHVPAPPDGCLHRIEISLGAASTVFYGRGPTAC